MPLRTFLAIDLETTGLNAGQDRITEIGMVRFTLDGVLDTFQSMVNPGKPIPIRIQQITGIQDEDVHDALHFNAMRLEIEEFIGDATIVGQNVGFDLRFLSEEGVEPRGAVLDTLDMAAILEPQLRDRSLGALAAHFEVEMPVAHRALADADATRSVFLALVDRARELPEGLLADLVALDTPEILGGSEDSAVPGDEAPSWALATLLRDLARERGISLAPRRVAAAPPSPQGRARPAPPSPQRSLDQFAAETAAPKTAVEPPVPPVPMTPISDRLRVDRLRLDAPRAQPSRPPIVASLRDNEAELPEQALAALAAGESHPDLFGAFEQRAEQMGMTRAVAQIIEAGGQLLVEAGTGTGKSLAYLIPAGLWALKTGERVIVSTNTINLQEQLIQKDAPALRALLADTIGEEAAESLRVVTLKGRRNYLCLRRVAQERVSGPASDGEASLLARLLVWLGRTDSGDRGELILNSQEEQLWERYSAEGEDCLSGGHCAYVRDGTCFLLRAKRAAEAAHIVIVNHALLLSDLAAGGSVLPSADTVIIDEAHHLEDSATSHLGASVSFRSLADVLDGVYRVSARGSEAGIVAGTELLARDPRIDERTRSDLRARMAGLPAQVSQVRSETEALFRRLRTFANDSADDRFGNSARLRLTQGVRAQPEWSQIEIEWERAFEALRGIESAIGELQAMLESIAEELSEDEPDGPAAGGKPNDDWESLVGEAASLREMLTQRAELCGDLLTRHDPATIVWLSTMRRSDTATINSAPLRVATLLAERFFEQKRSVVLTGATLTTEGNYDYLRERVGLEEAEEEQFGSPFDYRKAVRLILPPDMPQPNDSEYPQALADAIVELVRASEGRALILFTAIGALRRTADLIREPLEADQITVVAQGMDGSPRRIMRELASSPRTVALGVASLWEGVDVPGEAISLVAIARLPFPVPSDPVYAARSELYEDPFFSYAVPQAIVRFRQGFGRLIRRKDDRGVVAVLDGRITSKGYGKAFVRSLPPVEVMEVPLRDIGAATADWLQK
ncbi:MAG: DNA polymerase-3 subunit epsilon/ATP-dependent DNA helicase DinG [Chloroflexi bacterium]|nr:MAG: DNA polymerase-3 subunit epsilon/ATP-dependent DNA helicase DinG [Chloroflexota bacterium]